MFKVLQKLYTYISNCFIVCMAVVLLLSFGLHTIDNSHIHPGLPEHTAGHTDDYNGESSISEYAHTGEKKLFMLLVFSFLWLGLLVTSRNRAQFLRALSKVTLYILTCLRKRLTILVFTVTNWLMLQFTQGHLNPKLH